MNIEVLSTGSCLPQQSVANEAIEQRLALPSGWIEKRTGILRRPIASPEQATSDLAVCAAETALARAGIARKEIGLLLLATSTPDHVLPPTAPLVAHKLGLTAAGAVDLAGACSGFLYALIIGSAYSQSLRTPVLIAAANILSRRVDENDRATVSLFADGAGAVVVAPSNAPGLLGSFIGSNGAEYNSIIVPGGGTREPLIADTMADGRQYMKIADGPRAFRSAVEMMVQSGRAALHSARLSPDDIDWWIPHQANIRIIREAAKGLAMPMEKTVTVIDRVGNSSAATIPIALDQAVNRGQIKRGHVLLMTAAGAGMLNASVVVRW